MQKHWLRMDLLVDSSVTPYVSKEQTGIGRHGGPDFIGTDQLPSGIVFQTVRWKSDYHYASGFL